MNKRINRWVESQKVDFATGEIIESTKDVSYNVDREPDYVKLYLKDILYFSNMPQSLNPFLNALIKRVTYASEEWGNCIVLNKSIREVIKQECGYTTMQSVYNNTNKLIKGEVIAEVSKDIYRLNPFFFGRGEWKDIEKIRAEIDYSKIDGKSFKINFDYKNKDDEIFKNLREAAAEKGAEMEQIEGQTSIC